MRAIIDYNNCIQSSSARFKELKPGGAQEFPAADPGQRLAAGGDRGLEFGFRVLGLN